ncbi:MAG: ATP-dependent sacrificial sulfur transferase LarE [Thermoplasmata archaeon]|nr:ATP-dependent sacrificial sulfur transferase LarE [Thermoplasmata archaeon]
MDTSIAVMKKYIESMERAIVCFSGGLDSTVLLSICKDVLGDNVTAIMVDVPMISERTRDIAMVLANHLDIRLKVIKLEYEDLQNILDNGEDRCYICKDTMYRAIWKYADQQGIKWILNGDNADDVNKFRPGMKAAFKQGIKSPFVDANVGRKAIEDYYKSLNLPVNLVKETCMLMRYPIGTPVTPDDLEFVEDIEYSIRSISEVTQLRVRVYDGLLHIFTSAEEYRKLMESEEDIGYYLDSIGHKYVIEKEPYRG